MATVSELAKKLAEKLDAEIMGTEGGLAARAKKLAEKIVYGAPDPEICGAPVAIKSLARLFEQALLAERRLVWKQAEDMVLGMTRPTEASDRVERHVQAECDKCQSFVAAADALRAAAEKEVGK